MTKILPLNNVTYLDIPPDRVLEAAKGELEGVVIIGFSKKDSNLYTASSYADGGTVLWLLESCKHELMELDE